MLRAARLLLLVPLLAGCVHRIEVRSDPGGAMASFNGKSMGRVPFEVKVHPFGRRQLALTLPGYRPITLTIARTGTLSFLNDVLTLHWLRAVGLVQYSSVEVELLPEHGPIGTWNPDDLP